MSIANELSSDVAMAVLGQAAAKAASGTKGLREILLEVHSTLRCLTKEARRQRLSQLPPPPPPPANNAASGRP